MTSSRSPLKLKALDRQGVVITGATSGIGLSTARAAAARGATLMLAARNEEALKSVCDDLAGKGAKTAYVVADVGVEADVRAIAAAAIARFGGFDTWVNDAGVSIFGEITQTPIEDQRRLFETNYWGVVYGSLIAVEHFRERPGGGALINLGSVLGDLAIPLQGAYSASKHAIEGLSEGLRREMMLFGIDVIIVAPGAVKTPIWSKAEEVDLSAYRNSPYFPALERVRAFTRHLSEIGLPPEKIAQTIADALTSASPKVRYQITPDPMRHLITGMLPKRMVDKIIAKRLGLTPPA